MSFHGGESGMRLLCLLTLTVRATKSVYALDEINIKTVYFELCTKGVTMHHQHITLFVPAERIAPEQIADEAPVVQAALELRPLLDAVPNIVLVLNRYRQVIYSNQALLDTLQIDNPSQIYGLRPGEMLQCSHAFETHDGCGGSEACSTCGAAQAILMTMSGKAAVRECRIVTRAGTALDLRVWAKPIIVHGEPCTIFALTDISDEKRRDVLERVFLHDIHNTASLVVSYTDLIQHVESLSADERAQLMEQIQVVAFHMLRDIDTHRILIAAESNRLTLSPSIMEAGQALTDIKSEYSQYALDANITITIETPTTPINFTTDPSLLARVIGNMLKNALEASTAGDTVTLRVTADAETVTFEVHNALFMPRKVQLQVFQRSYSTKGTGRGLGTYSIKMLTEQYLQGKVWFESSEEGGTRFFARYPLHFTS